MADMYLEAIRLFFIVGGVISLVIGVLLFAKPELIARLSKTGNKWYSARKSTKPLDIIRDTDGFYFKNNKAVGITMLVMSVIALYLIITRIPSADTFFAVNGVNENALTVGLMLDALRWVLIAITVLGLPVWVMLAFNPEQLQKLNKKMNRWISTRLLLLPLERMNSGFDIYVLSHNRAFGMIFILGSVFILYKFFT
jgi:hypothetical protein